MIPDGSNYAADCKLSMQIIDWIYIIRFAVSGEIWHRKIFYLSNTHFLPQPICKNAPPSPLFSLPQPLPQGFMYFYEFSKFLLIMKANVELKLDNEWSRLIKSCLSGMHFSFKRKKQNKNLHFIKIKYVDIKLPLSVRDICRGRM